MILSSPFSRASRPYQSWSSAGPQHRDFRPHQQQQQQQHFQPLSSTLPRRPKQFADQQAHREQPTAGVGRANTLHRTDPSRAKPTVGGYAPSTGAGLRPQPSTVARCQPEWPQSRSLSQSTHYSRPRLGAHGDESRHYAATSFRATPLAGSESGRSGRESVMSNLMERMGTLKRRLLTTGKRASIKSRLPGAPSSPMAAEVYASNGAGRRSLAASEIYAEGLFALDSNARPRARPGELELELELEELLDEGETWSYIGASSRDQPQYRQLVGQLTSWINDELADQRIIVRDLTEDLFDGQVLSKLYEKLQQCRLDVVEVTQNEAAQRFKLQLLISTINRLLGRQARSAKIRWSAEGIHSKNTVEIIHLLVALAKHYQAPLKLPLEVEVELVVAQKSQGQILKRSHQVQLTTTGQSSLHGATDKSSIFDRNNNNNNYASNNLERSELSKGTSSKRDAFDILFDASSDKLMFVQQSLLRFCNRHLSKINMTCSSSSKAEILDPNLFSDGILLVFLISALENYFVPLGNLFTSQDVSREASRRRNSTANNSNNYTNLASVNECHYSEPFDKFDQDNLAINFRTAIQPNSYVNTQPIQMLHNVNMAFELIEESGIGIRQLARPEDIVNADLKSLMRVLYSLFSKYRHI